MSKLWIKQQNKAAKKTDFIQTKKERRLQKEAPILFLFLFLKMMGKQVKFNMNGGRHFWSGCVFFFSRSLNESMRERKQMVSTKSLNSQYN